MWFYSGGGGGGGGNFAGFNPFTSHLTSYAAVFGIFPLKFITNNRIKNRRNFSSPVSDGQRSLNYPPTFFYLILSCLPPGPGASVQSDWLLWTPVGVLPALCLDGHLSLPRRLLFGLPTSDVSFHSALFVCLVRWLLS